MPGITPHMLGHYFAAHSLRNGAKVELTSEILGHSSVGITSDVYRTVTQDEIREEHRRFGPMGGPNDSNEVNFKAIGLDITNKLWGHTFMVCLPKAQPLRIKPTKEREIRLGIRKRVM